MTSICRRIALLPLLAVLAVGFEGRPGYAQDAPPLPPRPVLPEHRPSESEPEPIGSSFAEPYKPYLSLCLPDQITSEEIERYANLMALSPEQRMAFEDLYQQYRRQEWDYRVREVKPLVQRSGEVAAMEYSLARGQATVDLQQEVQKCAPALHAFEDALFTNLAPLLAEEQLFGLERCRWARRRVWANEEHVSFPGCMLDLTEILDELRREGFDLTPDDPPRFEEALIAYEMRLTQLFEQRVRVGERVREQATMLIGEHQDIMRNNPDEAARARARELWEKRHELNREPCSVGRSILEFNRSSIGTLASHLPDEAAEKLWDRFLAASYPVVYPDPYDLRAVFASIEDLSNLSDDAREDFEEIRIHHLNEQQRINDAMLRLYLDWSEGTCRLSGYSVTEYERYAEEIRAIDAHRRDHADQTLDLLNQLSVEEVVAELQQAIEGVRQQIETALAERKQRQYTPGWPGP